MKTLLKELRRENHYTQKYIAEFLNIGQTTYSEYENGKHDIPLDSLVKLAKFYDTCVDFILGLTDYDFPYPR